MFLVRDGHDPRVSKNQQSLIKTQRVLIQVDPGLGSIFLMTSIFLVIERDRATPAWFPFPAPLPFRAGETLLLSCLTTCW
jgi:hypothetical protein